MASTAPNGAGRAILAALALSPSCALAQGIVSLESDVQYRHFTESDISVVSARNSGELSFGNGFGVQGDVLVGRINDDDPSIDGQFQGLTLHGIYDLGGGTAAGAFLGRDFARGPDSTVVGIEGRFDLQGSRIEPWVSYAFMDGQNTATFGLSAFSQMASGIGLEGQLTHARVENDESLTDIEFTTSYQFMNGAEVFGTAGYFILDDGTDSAGEATLGLGVRVDLGPEGGTRFGSRSFFDAIR